MSPARHERRARRAVLAAGGTGGHMFPAESLARALLARDWQVILITDRRGAGFGRDLRESVACFQVSGQGLAGGSLTSKVKGTLHLAAGTLQALRLMLRLKPGVTIGFGGYASVPPGLAAAYCGCPLVLHEQNAVLGRANRLLLGRAKALATAFAKVRGVEAREEHKVILTGNPVRVEVAKIGERPYVAPEADAPLNLLVFGGSQGARAFNELLPDAVSRLPETLRKRLVISQQVPGEGREAVATRYREAGVKATLAPFFTDLPTRLAGAHLVISRAGASTVAELSAAGRPGILIPYPFAADDHQNANAQALAEAGGAWLAPQHSLTPELLSRRLEELLTNAQALTQAAGCARHFAKADATERLTEIVEAVLLGQQPRRRPNGSPTREAAA